MWLSIRIFRWVALRFKGGKDEGFLMRTGTKSLLFGVHQVIWHPITVLIAWVYLFHKPPTWKELVCIIIHDWGYWGKLKMDDEKGERHPEAGAKIAGWLFGDRYYTLCLYHSRHYAKNSGKEPSFLCWADKYSIVFDPWWFYLPRAWLSGELFEYRQIAIDTQFISSGTSHRAWYQWIKKRLSTLGKEKRGDIVSYVNPSRDINH
jgi:hypothetical protein